MIEQDNGRTDGIRTETTDIGEDIGPIPSDEGTSQLVVSCLTRGSRVGDVMITIIDGSNPIPMPSMMFRAGFAGGQYAPVSDTLWQLYYAAVNGEEIEPRDLESEYYLDEFPRGESASVTKSRRKNSKYKITGLTHDDQMPSEKTSHLDIEVTQDGDVTLTRRELIPARGSQTEDQEAVLTAVFRTAENGGKHPVVAEAFGRIADRIAKSESRMRRQKYQNRY